MPFVIFNRQGDIFPSEYSLPEHRSVINLDCRDCPFFTPHGKGDIKGWCSDGTSKLTVGRLDGLSPSWCRRKK